MRVGDRVTIYEDPVTRQKKEGVAELLQKHYDLQDGFELWDVRFEGESGCLDIQQRIVLTERQYEVVTLEHECRKYVYLVTAVNKEEAEKKVMNDDGTRVDDYLVSSSLEGIESVKEM